MPISRRIFLRAGTMVVLGAAAQATLAKTVVGQKSSGVRMDAVTGFQVPEGSLTDPLTYYNKATFVAHLNSDFQLRRQNSSTSVVTLIKVVDCGPSKSKLNRNRTAQVGNAECFALVFQGVTQLPQDTYTVEHGALGTFQLLLVPSGKRTDVPTLEAVINRLHS
jgi:hypothetical protein